MSQSDGVFGNPWGVKEYLISPYLQLEIINDPMNGPTYLEPHKHKHKKNIQLYYYKCDYPQRAVS